MMTPSEKQAAVYAKLHENRYEHVTRARRERDLQEKLYTLTQGQKDWLALGAVIVGVLGAGFALGVAVMLIAQSRT